MDYNIVPIGTDNKKSVFYDKEGQQLLINSSEETSYKSSTFLFLLLITLPLLRWLDTYVIIDRLLIKLLILLVGMIGAYILSQSYLSRAYQKMSLVPFTLDEYAYEKFLEREMKNIKVARGVVLVLSLVLITTTIVYLVTSFFFFLFLTILLSFPEFLFLSSRLKERREIINQLHQEIESM